MPSNTRISSIDIMRGLTLVLMLFVNDLNMHTAPSWLGHMRADFDGMGLADWVFPGFLFIVGMAIPFAFSNRLAKGESLLKLSIHIIIRTLSLLVIGVLMLNSGRVDPDLTGMGENLWALLMYISVFLVWNDYPEKLNKYLRNGLRIIGIAALLFLVAKFRSGQPVNNGWLITGWWGILGLIGWGYLVSAFTYLLCRDSIIKTTAVILVFLVLNMLSGWNLLGFLDPVKPVFGIIIEGNTPLIVLTGLLGGIIIRKRHTLDIRKTVVIFIGLGILCLASGFILRNWFIISKIKATPSWGMICTGISFLLFILIYWIADFRNHRRWAAIVKPAGQYSLTTYLAPDILYYIIWMTGVPVLFYKDSPSALVVVAGSVAWALLMVGLTALLVRLNIKLRI
jgi:predicted acyltransferase